MYQTNPRQPLLHLFPIWAWVMWTRTVLQFAKTFFVRMSTRKRTSTPTDEHIASCIWACWFFWSASLPWLSWFLHLDSEASNNFANLLEHGLIMDIEEESIPLVWEHTKPHCPSESFDGSEMSTPFVVRVSICVSGQGVMPKFIVHDISAQICMLKQNLPLFWQPGTPCSPSARLLFANGLCWYLNTLLS